MGLDKALIFGVVGFIAGKILPMFLQQLLAPGAIAFDPSLDWSIPLAIVGAVIGLFMK